MPTNLRVLSKDLTVQQVHKTMEQWAADLRVLDAASKGPANSHCSSVNNPFQPVALQPVFRLQMPDARFNRRATRYPSPDWLRRSPSLPLVHLHFYFTFVFVPAITHINIRFTNTTAYQFIHLL